MELETLPPYNLYSSNNPQHTKLKTSLKFFLLEGIFSLFLLVLVLLVLNYFRIISLPKISPYLSIFPQKPQSMLENQLDILQQNPSKQNIRAVLLAYAHQTLKGPYLPQDEANLSLSSFPPAGYILGWSKNNEVFETLIQFVDKTYQQPLYVETLVVKNLNFYTSTNILTPTTALYYLNNYNTIIPSGKNTWNCIHINNQSGYCQNTIDTTRFGIAQNDFPLEKQSFLNIYNCLLLQKTVGSKLTLCMPLQTQ